MRVTVTVTVTVTVAVAVTVTVICCVRSEGGEGRVVWVGGWVVGVVGGVCG